MPNLINIVGRKFGLLTVLEREANDGDHVVYKCKCDCGNEKNIRSTNLLKGVSNSCGCKTHEKLTECRSTHKLSKTSPVYSTWEGMKQRCYNPRSTGYKSYGARGIIMCDEWKNDFQSFHTWCFGNGWKKGLDVDRVDNNGNYTPYNCRIVTKRVNSRNKRSNRMLTFNGECMCLNDWASKLMIKPCSLIKRLNNWPIEKALSIVKELAHA